MFKKYWELWVLVLIVVATTIGILGYSYIKSDKDGGAGTEFEVSTELGVKEDYSVEPLGSDYVWTKGWFNIGKTCFTDPISHKSIIDAGGVLIEGQSETLENSCESRNYTFEGVTLSVAYIGEEGMSLSDAKIVQLAVSEDIELCNGVHVGMSKSELLSIMGNPMITNTFEEFEVLTWMDDDSLYVWDCHVAGDKVTHVSLTYVTGG